MVKAYNKRMGENACEVFDEGDKVLVATRTDAAIKKMGDIRISALRKRNRLTAWSKQAYAIVDKRMTRDMANLAQESKTAGLQSTMPMKGTKSREWWKQASKAERKIALSYRYLLSNSKWYSGLDLLYIDPDVKYIPTKRGDAEWKLRSSKKAQQEAEMSDDELDEKRARRPGVSDRLSESPARGRPQAHWASYAIFWAS